MNGADEKTSDDRIRLKQAVVTEGRYDKIKLSSVIDGVILTTNGFGIYNDTELCRLIRFYAQKTGLVVITDSDAAGRQIRAYIKSILSPELYANVINIHIPQILGKEKRKTAPSKEGTLGVEGISVGVLRDLIERAVTQADNTVGDEDKITKNDLYSLGLSGTAMAAERRASLCSALKLPSGLSPSSLLDLLNTLYTKSRFIQLAEDIFGGK